MINPFKKKPHKCEERARRVSDRVEAMREDATKTIPTMVKNIQEKKCKKVATHV